MPTPTHPRTYPHGTNAAYSINRCRCQPCRDAHATYTRKRHRAIGYGTWQGRIDATGTTRRIRALATLGWSCAELGRRRGGIDKTGVQDLAHGKYGKVTAAVAADYVAIYDDLCCEDGPSARTRSWARGLGWHGPEAWTDDSIDDPDAHPILIDPLPDDVAVQRALAGQARYRRLHPTDRVEAYRQLTAAGHGHGAIQGRLHINADTLRQLADLAGQQEVAA